MRILVTGATGFVGGAVAAELAKRGLLTQCIWMVRAKDAAQGRARLLGNCQRFDPGISDADIPLASIVCADLADIDSLSQSAWADITHVIHCAALATFSNNPKIWAMNVEGTLALAKAVHAQGALQRWIQVGTAMSCGLGHPSPVTESWDLGRDDAAHLVPYTRSKIAVEIALKEIAGFPLVVARPSIVVGHSQLGCTPSTSIFWVFRMAVALERFTCAIDEHIDIIPADWCAEALVHLCLQPKLAHDLYHVSAGDAASNDFAQIDQAFANAQGTPPVAERYQQVALENLRTLVPLFEAKLGKINRILILRALSLYGAFAKLNYVFDNQRLRSEGVATCPPFASYIDVCIKTSEHIPLLGQMAQDFK